MSLVVIGHEFIKVVVDMLPLDVKELARICSGDAVVPTHS